jgi:hypothetical protein
VKQLEDNVAALNNKQFNSTELKQIELILSGEKFSVPSFDTKEIFVPTKSEGNTPSRGDFIKNLAKRSGNHSKE